MNDYIDTRQAALELGVTPDRVRKLIKQGRLPARKVGRDWLVAPADLECVRVRKPGRPRSDS